MMTDGVFYELSYDQLETEDKFGYIFYYIEDKFVNKNIPFDILLTNVYIRNHISYKVEGIANDSSDLSDIKIYQNNQLFYYDKTNTFELILYNDINNYTLYVNDTIRALNQSGIFGEISSSVNVVGCNVPPNSLFVKCFRNHDNLYIGTYPVINNTYVIPNLDINTYYDIILVDISRTIEQQVSSYRKPRAYG